jgi:hypothetical protein
MKKRIFALLVVLVLTLGFALPAQAREVYVVQRGDALWRIAASYGMTYQELAAYNNISNPHRIYAGQRLFIPAAEATPTVEAPPAAEATPEPQPIETPEPTNETTPDDTITQLTEISIIVGEDTSWPVGGTLTLPVGASSRNPVPGVILVHGSGPADRDSLVYGVNRPFFDIAEYLSANGVAVLRYDNRNLVHGLAMLDVYGPAFTVWEETIEAALDAARIMNEDPHVGQVYMLGLSLGGMLAPRIHAMGGDFDGIIMMAGSARTLMDIVLDQEWHLIELSYMEAMMQIEFFFMLADAGEYDFLRLLLGETAFVMGWGNVFEMEDEEVGELVPMLVDVIVMQMNGLIQMMESAEALANAIPGMTVEEARATRVNDIPQYAYYHRDIALHSTEEYLRKMDIPILVMQGNRDFQIFAEIDFFLLYEILSDRENATFYFYDGLNHLFMPSEANNLMEALEEYAVPSRVHPLVLRDIVEWIFSLEE